MKNAQDETKQAEARDLPKTPEKVDAKAVDSTATDVIKCPKCKGDTVVLASLMKDNRVVKHCQCKKCGKVFMV